MKRHDDVPLEHVTTTQQAVVRDLPTAALIEGARQRKNAHIGQLMVLYADKLREKLVGFAGDYTDDVITDTFLSLPEKLQNYNEEGKFEYWLFGIAFNLARTKRRSVRRRDAYYVDTTADGARMPSALVRVEEAQLLERAKELLTPAEREVWFLSFSGHGPQEIGTILGLKESAVNVRLHRARARLEKIVER